MEVITRCSKCKNSIVYYAYVSRDRERMKIIKEHYINVNKNQILCKDCYEKLHKQESASTSEGIGD